MANRLSKIGFTPIFPSFGQKDNQNQPFQLPIQTTSIKINNRFPSTVSTHNVNILNKLPSSTQKIR